MATQPKTLVALEPLYVGQARAHNRGDVVPTENVEPNGWTAQVAEHTSAKGREALGLPAESTAPAQGASKAAWAEYAVTSGAVTADDVDGLTKDQLVTLVQEHETGVPAQQPPG